MTKNHRRCFPPKLFQYSGHTQVRTYPSFRQLNLSIKMYRVSFGFVKKEKSLCTHSEGRMIPILDRWFHDRFMFLGRGKLVVEAARDMKL